MSDTTCQTTIAKMNFEQAMTALEEIVRRLESGQASLEDSITDYTRGTELKTHCMQKLSDAKLKVEKIIGQTAEGITTEPFNSNFTEQGEAR